MACFSTSPGCGCSDTSVECGGACNLTGPFTSCKYKIVVSGLPSSVNYDTHLPFDDDFDYYSVTASGFDSLNGTYYLDIPLDANGCPTYTGNTTLKTASISYSWTFYDKLADCSTDASETDSTSCSTFLRASADLDGSQPQGLMSTTFSNQSSCPDAGDCFGDGGLDQTWCGPIHPFWDDANLKWESTAGDCDKLPDGSETFTVALKRQAEVHSCIDNSEKTLATFTVEVTAVFT